MKRFFILLSIFLCIGCTKKIVSVHRDRADEVSYSNIYHIINNYNLYKDIDLIDVRDADSYLEGHIIGANNITYDELGDYEYSNRRIIVYSDNKKKSIYACRKLRKMGIDADYIPGIKGYPYDLV